MPITMTLTKRVEVPVDTLRIVAPVDYGDEDMPLDFYGRTGDEWRVDVDLDTGRIKGWPNGQTFTMCMKVRDGGTYTLMHAGNTVAERVDAYVPNCLGGGDYLEFEIDGTGQIDTMAEIDESDLGEIVREDD